MMFLKGFLIGLQFFTAVPIRRELPMDSEHLGKTVQAFPLLGLFQGIIYASLFFLLKEWTPFSHLAAAFLLWLATILLTGGIHLDGWMDASDAYFSYGNQEKRLEIMKDPRTGAFGVLSVIVLLSCRFLFIFEITESTPYFLIAAIPFFSKSVMGLLLVTVPSSRKEGLAAMFQTAVSLKLLIIYPIFIIIFLVLVIFLNENIIHVTILLLAAGGCYFLCRRNVSNWFGGITGDVLGASVEGTELILWMTVWLLHYFVMA
ncbi:adenosylcobinamide-GDP ribazoletransferase [Bacillus salipaludis]|uniref:Adenosylcobinamide-GDP ribazoletransferase n=1 Tax=Bacillus salipaludis TaxID=2547811 RepID=A0A4R5VXK9_9BACI|nr:adenosylcobinamide-GDP ribazoletransferase [Bacillus salipaludis]MDQ6597399.1 adenosylcobinamide-GDP ribazoletransferase [Bacillus salipaludis]TDK63172.1 adenosylcobinamide-GDP ribazoletransferase [Bacillus salipaludis]